MDVKDKIYIIAEAGVNHCGKLDLAKELVVAAKATGADCVKFQTFSAERLVTRVAPKAQYQLESTSKSESQFEMIKSLELPLAAWRPLYDFCEEQAIDFLSTPYDVADIEFLENLGVSAYKIASAQIVEPDLLQTAARTGKPLFVSTGMATLKEVQSAVLAVRSVGNQALTLLQCTTNYPSRHQDANLRALETMKKMFGVAVGYSDHTCSDTACLVAIGMGATVIEKHLTLDKSLPGPDHRASCNPQEFARLVTALREAELVLGSAEKVPCDVELRNARVMRRSLVLQTRVKAGQPLSKAQVTAKRPGTGIAPSRIEEIVGRVALRDLEKDEILEWSMLGAPQ